MAEETEKIYVIPLKNKNYKTSKAAPTAMTRVKEYLMKHMKVDAEKIWIDESLNHEVWNRGKYNMPNKIRVKAVKFDDGVVEVYLPELEFVKSRREILQEEKAKKQPILLKEEEVEEEMETGAEDFDVVPTADGDVKIKKKKHSKEEDEESEGEEVETSKAEEPSVEEEPVVEEKKTPKKEPKKKEDASEDVDTSEKEKDSKKDKKESG